MREQYRSFEHLEVTILSGNRQVRLVVVYRPPPSASNQLTWNLFKDEFDGFLSQYISTSGLLVIAGDFNVHLNKRDHHETRDFNNLTATVNLHHLINEPTHRHGNTLDQVLVREDDFPVAQILTVVTPPNVLSDHSLITIKFPIKAPGETRKQIEFRTWSRLDKDAFKERISTISHSICQTELASADDVFRCFSSMTKQLVDEMAPRKTKSVGSRSAPAFYSHNVNIARAERRRLEKNWRTTRTESNLKAFKDQCRVTKKCLLIAKKEHYSTRINECGSNQKELFRILDGLLHRKSRCLPTDQEDAVLAERFSSFFIEKIQKIRTDININMNQRDSSVHLLTSISASPRIVPQFDHFAPVSEQEVAKIMKSSNSKTCCLDVIPTWLLKECTNETISAITHIINTSLSSSTVPAALKEAVITPILKKPSLDHQCLSSYRPVSNLNFIGKLIEKVVSSRLNVHLSENNLLEPYQSAYRQHHSTETALTRVFNDIAEALDQRKAVLLVLLDLSAAFDTIQHSTLIQRCEYIFGITGAALGWLKSYLHERTQRVQINTHQSEPKELTCGVPQGSVLGPLLFILFTTPLGTLLRERGMLFHLYADDTQLYLTAQADDIQTDIKKMEDTVAEVEAWMTLNMLKCNTSKTEVVLIRDQRDAESLRDVCLNFNETIIQPSNQAKNIGVIFDQLLSMTPHITAITSSLNYHLRNIARIRPLLTRHATETLIHALVSSRLDYANAVLASLPACRLRPLQLAQNTAARIVTRTPRREHITPLLQQLHWLPVRARIEFKLAILAFKCLHGTAPDYLAQLICPYHSSRDLRSIDQHLLVPAPWRTQKFGIRRFAVAGPLVWNSLPVSLRVCNNFISFKNQLKTFLFTRHYFT